METKKLRKVGVLLRDSWQTYIKNFSGLIRTYLYALIGFLPLMAVIVLFVAYRYSFVGMPLFWEVFLGVILAYAAMFSLGFLIYMAVSAYLGLFAAIKDDFKSSPRKNLEKGKERFWSYIVISILTFLLILFWFTLLIIPAIVFSVFYGLAVYVLFFEGKREMEAICRSKELVKGHFWGVFGRILILFAIVIAISAVFSWLRGLGSEQGLWFSLMSALEQVVSFVITPFYIIYNYFIYKDLAKNS